MKLTLEQLKDIIANEELIFDKNNSKLSAFLFITDAPENNPGTSRCALFGNAPALMAALCCLMDDEPEVEELITTVAKVYNNHLKNDLLEKLRKLLGETCKDMQNLADEITAGTPPSKKNKRNRHVKN